MLVAFGDVLDECLHDYLPCPRYFLKERFLLLFMDAILRHPLPIEVPFLFVSSRLVATTLLAILLSRKWIC